MEMAHIITLDDTGVLVFHEETQIQPVQILYIIFFVVLVVQKQICDVENRL